jgi:uncharacterized membrane protein YvbJ
MPKYCSECGTKLDKGSELCSGCGSKVEEKKLEVSSIDDIIRKY